MQLRFFTIPVHGGDEAAEALNRFLGGHRVLAITLHAGAVAWRCEQLRRHPLADALRRL